MRGKIEGWFCAMSLRCYARTRHAAGRCAAPASSCSVSRSGPSSTSTPGTAQGRTRFPLFARTVKNRLARIFTLTEPHSSLLQQLWTVIWVIFVAPIKYVIFCKLFAWLCGCVFAGLLVWLSGTSAGTRNESLEKKCMMKFIWGPGKAKL